MAAWPVYIVQSSEFKLKSAITDKCSHKIEDVRLYIDVHVLRERRWSNGRCAIGWYTAVWYVVSASFELDFPEVHILRWVKDWDQWELELNLQLCSIWTDIYHCPKLLQEWKLFRYITTPFLYYVVKFWPRPPAYCWNMASSPIHVRKYKTQKRVI